jgi:F-type H+-transporting ATPase subunit delta
MSNYSIAKRYNKSLIDLAMEMGVLEEVHNDMLLVDKVIRENREFGMMLKSPVISHQKKVGVMAEIFGDKVSKMTMSLFEIISRKNRENILPEIARLFHEQYNVQKGITEANVITQYPIDDSERKTFVDLVKQTTGAKTVVLNEITDPDIIGGFILRIGDKQIDHSLRRKLNELKIKFES